MARLRKHLYMPGLLSRVHSQFNKIPDPIGAQTKFSLSDCLMSGLAMFGMKYPSLLKFDDAAHNDDIVRHNLKKLYGVSQAPCDSYFRERLDSVDPEPLQRASNRVIAQLQRGKLLETYRFYQDAYLVPMDGSGYFSSSEIHCASCSESRRFRSLKAQTVGNCVLKNHSAGMSYRLTLFSGNPVSDAKRKLYRTVKRLETDRSNERLTFFGLKEKFVADGGVPPAGPGL